MIPQITTLSHKVNQRNLEETNMLPSIEPKKIKEQKHNPEYDGMVPSEIFDVEDSDEMAEMYADMFGFE